MTDSPAEVEFAPEAEARFADYLREVRAALAGVPDVNPDEIEADVREHVENELHAKPRPVRLADLEAVLVRLGPPTQWAPARTGLSMSIGQILRARWQGLREAIWRGPEDWRLAYLAFGVFAIGVLAFPLFPLFLVLSYILSRAAIALAKEKGVALGARNWLVYPPVVLVSVSLLVACVVGMPLMVTGVTTVQVRQVDDYERWELAGKPGNFNYNTGQQLAKQRPDVVTTLDRVLALFPGNRDVREGLAAVFLGAGLFAFWWAILGALAGSFPATVRAVFLPICNGFERKHGWRLAAVSLAVLFFWGVLAYEIAADAGLTG